jgi:hypothetical protein
VPGEHVGAGGQGGDPPLGARPASWVTQAWPAQRARATIRGGGTPDRSSSPGTIPRMRAGPAESAHQAGDRGREWRVPQQIQFGAALSLGHQQEFPNWAPWVRGGVKPVAGCHLHAVLGIRAALTGGHRHPAVGDQPGLRPGGHMPPEPVAAPGLALAGVPGVPVHRGDHPVRGGLPGDPAPPVRPVRVFRRPGVPIVTGTPGRRGPAQRYRRRPGIAGREFSLRGCTRSVPGAGFARTGSPRAAGTAVLACRGRGAHAGP